ncbi:MAG TPA: hypothetical protein VFJ06_14135 [Halococcus sp.]|nr:hypothetical protein [Halococcus sp.]
MQAEQRKRMALSDSDLRDIDRVLLDYLAEGRVTPVYARERIVDESHRDDVTSAYLGQRLKRLVEHGHADNLYDVGLYQIVTDPREKND